MTDTPNDETILQEAQRLVYGDRQAAYGSAYDDYSRVARMWEAILKLPPLTIKPSIAALMMCAVKISRECHAHKRDNLVDLAGYAAVAAKASARQEELGEKP